MSDQDDGKRYDVIALCDTANATPECSFGVVPHGFEAPGPWIVWKSYLTYGEASNMYFALVDEARALDDDQNDFAQHLNSLN